MIFILAVFAILLTSCGPAQTFTTKQEYARNGFYEKWYDVKDEMREGIVHSYWRGFLIAETEFRYGQPLLYNLCAVPGTTPTNSPSHTSCYSNGIGMTSCETTNSDKPNMFRSTYLDCMKMNNIPVCERGGTIWAGDICLIKGWKLIK